MHSLQVGGLFSPAWLVWHTVPRHSCKEPRSQGSCKAHKLRGSAPSPRMMRQPSASRHGLLPPPAGRPNHALPASPNMRLRDFELAVVEDGSRQPLPEVTAESGDTYVVAAPGQQFEVQASFQDA